MNYQETSREAWESFSPEIAGDLDKQILYAIHLSGKATCQKIEEMIDRSHQSVSGNLRHLVERGYVEPSGEYGVTTSGRQAIMWQLVKE